MVTKGGRRQLKTKCFFFKLVHLKSQKVSTLYLKAFLRYFRKFTWGGGGGGTMCPPLPWIGLTELSITVHYSSNYVQSHSYCNTQFKKVRWGQVVTKSIHCHFPWSLLLRGCHLKVSRRRPPNRAQYSNILAFSNMPEGQDKSPVRYI